MNRPTLSRRKPNRLVARLVPLAALAAIVAAAKLLDPRSPLHPNALDATPVVYASAPAKHATTTDAPSSAAAPARARSRPARALAGDGALPPARFAARVDRTLATTLVARPLPPEATPAASATLVVRTGDVKRGAEGELRLVDALGDGARGTRVELVLVSGADGVAVEARACDFVPSDPAARGDWTELDGTLRVSASGWMPGDELVVHYAVRGTDVAGLEREESGLVRLRVP